MFPWVPIAIQAVGIFHWVLLRPITTEECNWEEELKSIFTWQIAAEPGNLGRAE